MAHPGINAYFALDNASNVLTPISSYLDGVTPSSDTDELDGTVFQPGVAAPTRDIIPGFRTRGFSLSVKWTAAAETFFSAIEGMQGLDYEYGPLGNTVGMPKISGTCSCLSWTGPVSTATDIITSTCELRVATRVVGTF